MNAANLDTLKPRMIGWLTGKGIPTRVDATEQEVSDAFVKLVSSSKPRPSPAADLRLANDRQPMKQLTIKTHEFLEAVRLIEARGVTRKQAWDIATGTLPRLHQQVALENSLPAGAQLSADGQSIVSDWPVTPEVLAKLGLPRDATQQEYLLYRRAEAVEPTPEIAALLVRELIQFSQIKHATTFSEGLEFLQKHKPQWHAMAVKPQ